MSSTQYVAQQVTQYLLQLQNIRRHLSKKDTKLPHLRLLSQKINIKCTHFQNALQHLRVNNHSDSSLKYLASHLASSFSQLVKESHRLLQMKTGEDGEKRLKGKLAVLREMEEEMNQEWQGASYSQKDPLWHKIDENTTMLSDEVDQTKLKSLAKDYLNKQFLSIRMITYKMYQQYTVHAHPDFLQRVQELYKEQQELAQIAEELSQFNKQMREEEKRLNRELNQIKQTNQMVSRRYFKGNAPGEDK